MELLNSYIAVNNFEFMPGNENVIIGTVRLVADDVNGISAGNQVIFIKQDGQTVMINGKEFIVIKSNMIVGKV